MTFFPRPGHARLHRQDAFLLVAKFRPVAWLTVCAVVVAVYSGAQLFNAQIKDLDGAVLLVNCMHVAVGLVAAFVLLRLASN